MTTDLSYEKLKDAFVLYYQNNNCSGLCDCISSYFHNAFSKINKILRINPDSKNKMNQAFRLIIDISILLNKRINR